MEFMLVIIVAVGLIALAFLGLAIKIVFTKGGKFPNTHVGGNPYLKRQGISCAKTQDRIEQARLSQEVNFKKIRFVGIVKENLQPE